MSGKDEQIGPGIPSFPLTRGLMFVLLGFSLFPIAWIMLTSIKTELDIFSIPPQVFVRPDFTSYTKFLGLGSQSALPFIWNSIFIAVVTTVLTLLISSLAAYAFSRYRFRWSGHLHRCRPIGTRCCHPASRGPGLRQTRSRCQTPRMFHRNHCHHRGRHPRHPRGSRRSRRC